MSDEGAKKDEIPAFKFTSKKVDDSWKEEVRREREAAAAKAAAQQKATLASLESAATGTPGASVPPAGKVAFDAPTEKEKKAPEPARAPEAPAPKAAEPSADEKAASLEQQRTRIFLNFLEGLAQQALMQLGEMENPYTGQAELDLQGARYTLELLATIQAKTKGNLNETENKALTGLLNDLRQSFAAIAQEMQRQMQAQAAQRSALKSGGPK